MDARIRFNLGKPKPVDRVKADMTDEQCDGTWRGFAVGRGANCHWPKGHDGGHGPLPPGVKYDGRGWIISAGAFYPGPAWEWRDAFGKWNRFVEGSDRQRALVDRPIRLYRPVTPVTGGAAVTGAPDFRWTSDGHVVTQRNGRSYQIFRHGIADADGAAMIARALNKPDLVECEDCCFVYSAEHMDVDDEGYTCPVCSEAELIAKVRELTEDKEEGDSGPWQTSWVTTPYATTMTIEWNGERVTLPEVVARLNEENVSRG